MSTESTYHSGEIEMQDRTGERAIADRNGRVVSDRIPRGARKFVDKQRIAVISTMDGEQDVWATILAGDEGFVSTADELDVLHVDDAQSDFLPEKVGDPVGVLLIELATRRRLRVNGFVSDKRDHGFSLAIAQAYPNCPKYIQQRLIEGEGEDPEPVATRQGEAMDDEVTAWIHQADTMFVASSDGNGLHDASHRGGTPGFVEIRDGALWVPDYSGNSMFNTLGNFLVNPRAGIAFPDFKTNRQLRMTGAVTVEHDVEASDAETGGTKRWWRFRPTRWNISPIAPGVRWSDPVPSPHLPK